ncbi:MAG: glutamate mutase L [Chloroflexi bacterium]|nr:glutamate mutase L [Chloroflexota bacterium]
MNNNQPNTPSSAPTIATVGAVVAVDIGSLYTRTALFDIVGDEYRFIARAAAATTAEAPYADVTSGLYNAIQELEQITGRKLTDGTRLLMPQRRDGSGIDLFIVTASAAPALRLVVAAVSGDISEASAMQAAHSTYTQIVSHITLDEGIRIIPAEDDAILSSAATAWLQEQTDKLLAQPPDVVLMAGGIDNGPIAPLLRLARVISGAAREQSDRAERVARIGKSAPGMPTVIFAGNRAASESVAQALSPISEIRSVPNLRPELNVEQTAPVEAALASIYHDRSVPQIPGYNALSRWIEGTIVPTAECERLIARYLSAHYERETLIADVGATSTSLFLANKDYDQAVVLGGIGMAYGLGNLLAERGVESALRWLPFDITPEDLTDWVLNKVIRPLSLPQTARDLAIEQALARECLSAARESLQAAHAAAGGEPRYDLLIGTGGLLANTPRPGQAALLMLDALQPTAEGLGSVELAVDTTMLIPPLGNLARHHLAAAAYIFDRDCLVWLGTAIILHGASYNADDLPSQPRRPAVIVTIEREQGAAETVEVPYGTIQTVPLRPDQRASLTVKPAPGFRIGSSEPGRPLKTQPGQEVKGGIVGLIIDARGRPLTLPSNPDARRSQLRRWWSALDAIPTGETFQTGPFAPPEPPQNFTTQHDNIQQ